MRARRLLRLLFLASLTVAPGRASVQEAPGSIRVERLRASIHVASGFENGNVLILASDTGLLLVDSQSAKRVAALDSAITRISAQPVRVVVNSHYHADHTEGNAVFRQLGAAVIAQRNVSLQAAKDTTIVEWDNWHRTPLASAAMPTRLIDDSLAFTFGAERVVLLHAPHAHTDGDLMVWLPRANVLHIGDILEVGAPPFIDWWSGGSLRGMVQAIDRVLAMVNDRTAIVPGHGAVSSRADLVRYREMLTTVESRVAAQATRGVTLAEVLAARPAREWEASLGGERRAGHLVRLVYYGATHPR